MNSEPINPIEDSLADQRRPLSVGGHHAWRECFYTRPHDDIDEDAADPIHDHAPQLAPKHKVRSVLAILDQLDKEKTNRRFNT